MTMMTVFRGIPRPAAAGLVVLSFAGIVGSLGGCAIVPLTGRSQLSLVSESELAALGAQDYKDLLAGEKLSKNQAEIRTVAVVGQNVARSAEQFMRANGMAGQAASYRWEFTLIEDDATANAFCMPGGKVGVYSGILPITKNSAGLAVVVAHEVAHAIANHGGERMSQLLLAQLGGMALSQALQQKPQETQQLAMMAYGLGANVGVLLPYDRKQESEADRIGLILMAQAGYDPQAAIAFWQRMEAQGSGEPPEFLSTHPSHATRISDLRKWLPEAMKYYKPRS